MALTVTMPQLGESVTEGTIARWLKQAGERVERYESIAEVVTDKVNAEVPSPVEVRLIRINVPSAQSRSARPLTISKSKARPTNYDTSNSAWKPNDRRLRL